MKRYNYEFGKTDNGVLSNVSGYATETNNFGESAFGVLNKSTLDEDNFTTQSVVTSSKATIFSVGNGDSIENRKNIIELKANGDTYIVNVGGYDGTNCDNSKNLEEEFTGIHEDIRELNEDVDRIDNTIASIHIDNVDGNELVYELLIDGHNRGTINIPKDQFLKDVDYDGGSKELIFTFSVRVEGNPLQTEDKIVRVDIANLVDTYSAGNGLNLVDHQFSVKVDPASDSHLSVSSDGLKLTSFDDTYATQEDLNEYLPLSGGTVTGRVNFNEYAYFYKGIRVLDSVGPDNTQIFPSNINIFGENGYMSIFLPSDGDRIQLSLSSHDTELSFKAELVKNGIIFSNGSNNNLLTSNGSQISISDIISQVDTPTNISELVNDAGYQTEAQVAAKVSALVDSAPETLDTLNELAAALGNDPNFATTVANQIGTKLSTSVYNADKATFALKSELSNYLSINGGDVYGNINIQSDTDESSLVLSNKGVVLNDATHINPSLGGGLFFNTNGGVTSVENIKDYFTEQGWFLTSIPAEYITESELTAKGYITETALKTINSQSIIGSGDIQIPQPTVKAASGTLTLWTGTQALYDAIADKSYETLYFVVDPSEKAYGAEWSGTQSTLTRIGNMEYHKTLPIQSKMKGCVHQNGVIQYYLDPEDWTKKADGTASKLDGTDGEVGVEVPRFYIWEEKVDNNYRVWISEERICSQAEESPHCIVSAFRCTYDNTASTPKLISIANTDTKYRGGNRDAQYDQYLSSDPIRSLLGKPATSMTRSTARTYARNNGCELLSYTQYKNIFYWLYVIEYANFNSQAGFNSSLTSDGYHQGGLGNGVTTYNWDAWNAYNGYCPLTPNGYLNEFGNGTGTKSFTIPEIGDYSTYTLSSIKWRGFENPFGDIFTNLDGIIFDRTGTTTSANITAHIITDPAKYADVVNSANDDRRFTFNYPTNTYIAGFVDSVNADIIPASSGGTSTSGKCDYCWSQQDNGNTSYPNCLLVGGTANAGARAGLAYFHCRSGVSSSSQHFGFRTIKVLE